MNEKDDEPDERYTFICRVCDEIGEPSDPCKVELGLENPYELLARNLCILNSKAHDAKWVRQRGGKE
jgi:hypothetical protein